LDVLKSGSALHATVINEVPEISIEDEVEVIEEMDTEEVTSFAEIMPFLSLISLLKITILNLKAKSKRQIFKRFITR
jgi:hypothetical protein